MSTQRGRPIDYAAQVRRAWGKKWKEPEVVYQFSNGRKFKSTDHLPSSGLYGTRT